MAIKTKENLKEVFSGISSVFFQKTNATVSTANSSTTLTIAPEYDLPVHVDDLSLTESAPTVNHYKVFGLDVDWTSTATKGDFEISMLVPTLHDDVLKLCYGEDAVSTIAGITSTDITGNWSGSGIELGMNQITGTMALLNQAKDRLLVIMNVSLWASVEYANGTTDPVGIRLTGTVETNGSTPDIIYLKKAAS